MRISLANKCQLLFGLAVLLILGAALLVLRYRMNRLVNEGQNLAGQRLVDVLLMDDSASDVVDIIGTSGSGSMESSDITRNKILELAYGSDFLIEDVTEVRFNAVDPANNSRQEFTVTVIKGDAMARYASDDLFVGDAKRAFDSWPNKKDYFRGNEVDDGVWRYRLARAVRQSELDARSGDFTSTLSTSQVVDPLQRIVIIEWEAGWPEQQKTFNSIYLLLAGLVAVSLAIVVFWFITTRIILSPVRVLRETAKQVAEGDINIRADISTGDEFEELSIAFNEMLANIKQQQDQLKNLNQQLDSKVSELAEANVALYESSQLKSDFLANVSHELRTPLNSIIGFAELLMESIEVSESSKRDRRLRYSKNIVDSGRTLLQMINELLDLAKIEAGRIEINPEPISVADMCETLLGLISPQADRKHINLKLEVDPALPIVTTDPGKFQQILFNFLSNAVKFTPDEGHVILSARQDLSHGDAMRILVSVQDNGPGIPEEKKQVVFEKFRQLDSSHTKEHAGTGLGLAISSELAKLLDSEIILESREGFGAKFTLSMPVELIIHEEPLTAGQKMDEEDTSVDLKPVEVDSENAANGVQST